MRHHRSLLVCLAVASLLTCSSAAEAKSLTVSGRVDHAGYTVVALGYNGKVALSRTRAFKLRVPAAGVTLQLVTAQGVYGGPVVVAGRGGRTFEGITSSVALGKIKVMRSAGYARLAHPLAKKTFKRVVDTRRPARTRRGAPLGNGRNFGFVSSPGRGAAGAGLDRDQDGVPDALDVAADGRRILNALVPVGGLVHGARLRSGESTRVAKAAGASGSAPQFDWMSQIFLPLDQTVNADAAGATVQQIDAMLVQQLNVKGLNVPHADLVELDCGGLSYCSPGTSADVVAGDDMGPNPLTQPLGGFFDVAGYAVLTGPGAAPLETTHGSPEFSMMPRATSDQIRTGDTPILRTTTGGALTQTPAPIDFVFDTVPALASYDDGAGDAGTVAYPALPGEPGTQSNPIAVAASPSGEVAVTLKFWRPQRKGIPGAGEPAFMDIGHLQYTVDATSLAQAAAPPGTPIMASSCSGASLSTTDSDLSVTSQPGPGAGNGLVSDSAGDQPATPANTLSFTIDLTKCLTDGGAPGFPVGTAGALGLKANAPGSSDHAVQNVWIKRVR